MSRTSMFNEAMFREIFSRENMQTWAETIELAGLDEKTLCNATN